MGFGAGGGSGNSSVSSATDVALSNPVDGHLFSYDGSTAKWQNEAPLPERVAINARTASYTLALSDEGRAVEVTASGATTVTVPSNSSVAFAVGTVIEIAQIGTGSVSIAPGSGVTIQSAGGALTTRAQFSAVSLRKRSTNTWLLVGDTA